MDGGPYLIHRGAVEQELREAGDNHHHLVCRGCAHTEDVDRVVGEWSCLELAGKSGYVIDKAEVVFWGLCPACQATRQKFSPIVSPSSGRSLAP